MIRTLAKRGLQIESFCRSRDTTGRGLIDKKSFTSMLRSIGLPFVSKELVEIAVRYTVPSSDMVDYETLLRDAGILGADFEGEGLDGQENLRGADISEYTGVLIDVKRMLLETVQSLGKQKEDVYRMLAQWDTEGTGTVTATQFLRVLARLHVDLSDQDQDLVVELLDINAKGRIDFIALLNFCFADLAQGRYQQQQHGPPGSPVTALEQRADDATNVETLSAVSAEALREEQRSVGSGNGNTQSRRPHTATSTRPVAPDNLSYQRSAYGGDDRELGRTRGSTGSPRGSGSSGGGDGDNNGGPPHADGSSQSQSQSQSQGGTSTSKGQRPLTASARVSTNQHEQITQHKKNLLPRGARVGDTHLVMQLPDDVIDDDDDLMLLTPHSTAYNNRAGGGRFDEAYSGAGNRGDNRDRDQGGNSVEVNDGASFNDNTLVTDHDEFYFGSPQGNLTTINSTRDMWNSQSLDGLTASQDNQPLPHQSHQDRGDGGHIQWAQTQVARSSSLDDPVMEPNEHLALLATQTLATVREMVISRYHTGKSLEDIFLHFDRRNNGFFDHQDFKQATLDLRIETSERVAQLAIQQIALDGRNNVSLGEFKVFIADPDHTTEVQENVQTQIAKQLEKQGRKFQNWLYNIFWEEDETQRGQNSQAAQTGLVSREAFVSAFNMLGVRLSERDLDRLVTRFDIHGNGSCSVTRFLQMAQSSNAWQSAEKNLAIQEEAIEEAAALRQQFRETGVVSVSEEVIAMAEYLGIRVISEPHMLWIARDALKAPLPINWTVQRDSKGRVFFYNHLSNQSRWDHPSDPHFHSLRDKCRREGSKAAETHFNSIPGTISFGGVGASISPPPLNIHVLPAGGSRPTLPATATLGLNRHTANTRPNSAGALLGHGLTAQDVGAVPMVSSTSGSRLPPASGATGAGQYRAGGNNRAAGGSGSGSGGGSRPRPQSALPERHLHGLPSAVAGSRSGVGSTFADGASDDYRKRVEIGANVMWRDDTLGGGGRGGKQHQTRSQPPQHADYATASNIVYSLNHNDLGVGMTLTHTPGGDFRPSSAPNWGSGGAQNKSGYGRVDSSDQLGAITDKKYSTDAIYRAPYFDLANFTRDANAGHHRPKKVSSTAQRSRDGGGSNSNTKKTQAARGQTAVDRAINYGNVPSYLQPKSSDPLLRERERQERARREGEASNQRIRSMLDDSFVQRIGSYFT